MVVPNMSKFFKIKFKPEVTPGLCPHCDTMTTFLSIVTDLHRCMHCGEDVKQEVNGVIRYLPLGQEFNLDSVPKKD